MTCSVDELLFVAKELTKYGVCAFFPTIMTDDFDVIKKRINVVRQAKRKAKKRIAQIVGVHLEGPFINSQKAGIHNRHYISPLTIENYSKIDDEIIKIVTFAPELDQDGSFIEFLKSKNIKLSAGHSVATNLDDVNQVTHLYNAMGSFTHRGPSTIVSALTNDNIFIELIADSMHVDDDVLRMTLKQKPIEKVLLISDALPLAHSAEFEMTFAGQKIYNNKGFLTNADGTFAGSSMLLADIVKNLVYKKLLTKEDAIKAASSNLLNYHNIDNTLNVFWNDLNIIERVEFI
jgi:N-acetylglucosamine-6-phosphate deacetylase